MLDFIRGLVAKEPARLVGYGSALVVAAALKGAALIGVTLPPDVLAAISLVTGFVISELIRRFVYAPATVQAKVDEAADTGNTDIGAPPKG